MSMTANFCPSGLRANQSGTAMIELALAAPVFAILVLGLIDYSLWAISRMSVERAARAGAEYAVATGFNRTAIDTAITTSSSARGGYLTAIAANPAPTSWCGCATGTGVTTASCNATCASGLEPGTYVTSSASANYRSVVTWPGGNHEKPISTSVSVRID